MNATGGRGGAGGAGGTAGGGDGLLVVDTGVLDEALERAERAGGRSAEAADGLQRLPVTGVVAGADAVLDALGDLGRQWSARLDDATGQARAVAHALRTARTEYVRTEREADAVLRGVLTGTYEPAAGGTP